MYSNNCIKSSKGEKTSRFYTNNKMTDNNRISYQCKTKLVASDNTNSNKELESKCVVHVTVSTREFDYKLRLSYSAYYIRGRWNQIVLSNNHIYFMF